MGITKADDELFTRAISGYRDAFLVEHSHLPESQRNELWVRRLQQFLAAPASSNSKQVHGSGTFDRDGSTLEKSTKRTRQDTSSRTIPGFGSGSGLPLAKRRATVCDLGLLFPPSLCLSVFPSRSAGSTPCLSHSRQQSLDRLPGLTIGRLRNYRLPSI